MRCYANEPLARCNEMKMSLYYADHSDDDNDDKLQAVAFFISRLQVFVDIHLPQRVFIS